ncbi:hypothetical protein L2E69_21440 [Planktothrix agardhii 1806]|jgi:hypothetical protein|uniref:Uncharacterized protein n=1 Tax=Planktothrix agardhii TaxID=1160 RepID=A0A1J1JL88_PLAAG|nr:hypothetical protein [Planktothrix agardhii]MBG0746376.1 hypothetical protein [Planktothrix agardhii KL2]MCF3573135.1 hypothetical protein [Planktothrix agardhii 1805]MCF3576915.1 hypothetical protein [Planktothrix agardhii 1812]MCF3582966.1 hypothetical protein [Planktothrix agardhii 1811]MCF3583729.1 hypothetical protein [Planktothrix agardhii 1803]
MVRLYNQSFEILKTELKKCAEKDLVGEVGEKIVLKRLEKMRSQSGESLTLYELKNLVSDQFYEFDEVVLQKAAKANHPPGIGQKLALGTAILGGFVGLVALANLPYPMIRFPVSKTVPILLIPSYISMDYNYRQAVSLVEQSDQLINQATAITDIELGVEKVGKAQQHLDKLPVWFLGYYPQAYCSFTGCVWRFTFDEYEGARKNIGRMESKIFQEQNAYQEYTKAEQLIKESQNNFSKTPPGNEQQQMINLWQKAIDQLDKISSETLAGKLAEKQLETAKRDFQQQLGFVAGTMKGNTLIDAGMQFGIQAAKAAKNPPHTAKQWEQVIKLWQEAIRRLEQVPTDNPSYLGAQKKLAEYQSNLGVSESRLEAEKDAVESLKQAKAEIAQWQTSARSKEPNIGSLIGQLTDIISILEQVPAGTTVSAEAQKLLGSARHTRDKLYMN